MAVKHPDECVWLEPQDWERLGTSDLGGTEQVDDASVFVSAMNLAAVSQVDFDKYMSKVTNEPRSEDEIKRLLPEPYKDKAQLINPIEANNLPPLRSGVDHTIELTDDKPRRRHIYGLSRLEALAVKEYAEQMAAKGFIRPSRSPFASPVLGVKKPNGD